MSNTQIHKRPVEQALRHYLALDAEYEWAREHRLSLKELKAARRRAWAALSHIERALALARHQANGRCRSLTENDGPPCCWSSATCEAHATLYE